MIIIAKDFARKFYNSSAWKRTRKAYVTEKHNLCERCGEIKNRMIVHHLQYLTPYNINDPEITLSFKNLELLCIDCHSREHLEKYSPVKQGYKFDSQGNYIKIEGENGNE